MLRWKHLAGGGASAAGVSLRPRLRCLIPAGFAPSLTAAAQLPLPDTCRAVWRGQQRFSTAEMRSPATGQRCASMGAGLQVIQAVEAAMGLAIAAAVSRSGPGLSYWLVLKILIPAPNSGQDRLDGQAGWLTRPSRP